MSMKKSKKFKTVVGYEPDRVVLMVAITAVLSLVLFVGIGGISG